MTPRRSILHPIATEAGATLQERFGWELPVAYADVASEYRAATEGAALHDASYFGRLKATGRDVLDLLNRMSTNRVVSLQPGQGAPTILTTDRGRVLDLIGVVNTGEHILLLTSPGTQQTVIDWLEKYTIMEEVAVEDLTATTPMLAVLGPGSQAALESATGALLAGLAPFDTTMVNLGGQAVRVIRQPLGGLPRFDLLPPPEAAAAVWLHLVRLGLTPVGVEAFEALRVRYGVPAHGREMGESYNPLEVGLIGSIDFHKGCYIGQEVIARLDTYKKVQRSLVMLRFPPEVVVAAGLTLGHEGRPVGAVTSVSRIPTTGQLIGLGYVRQEASMVSTRLELREVPGGWAEIEGLPQLFGPGQD